MVSPSVPNLRLSTCEAYVEHVRFFAYFGLRAGTATRAGIGSPTVQVGIDPNASGSWDATDGIVEFTFEGGSWARMSLAFGAGHILNPDEFDDSLVPYSSPPAPADMGTQIAGFHSLWRKTGNCPDPRAYVVESSQWIAELKLHGHGCEHLVIEGHDAYVEILAKSWQWREIVVNETRKPAPMA